MTGLWRFCEKEKNADLRSELRILLAEEAHRWIKEDVPAGRTAKAHLAIARRLFHPVDQLVSEMDRGVGRIRASGQ
jgi:hypothetical protein